MKNPQKLDQFGFTLVEMMIALSLFSVVMLAASSVQLNFARFQKSDSFSDNFGIMAAGASLAINSQNCTAIFSQITLDPAGAFPQLSNVPLYVNGVAGGALVVPGNNTVDEIQYTSAFTGVIAGPTLPIPYTSGTASQYIFTLVITGTPFKPTGVNANKNDLYRVGGDRNFSKTIYVPVWIDTGTGAIVGCNCIPGELGC